jgi:hypothetical protein
LLDNGKTDLLGRIKASWSADAYLQQVIHALEVNPRSYSKFSWVNGELLKDTILQWLHDSALEGHSGRYVTVARIKSLFYWKGMNKDIHNYVRNYGVCQQSKPDLAGSPGVLQPLPVPQKIWADISMDFIESLPNSSGKQVILVVVDKLSKYAHFISLAHPYTVEDVARIFMDNIFKLHGMPDTITSYRDPIFVSRFWSEFFKLQGVALNKSTAYHPQSDGQTEVVHKCLETYLRCMCSSQ